MLLLHIALQQAVEWKMIRESPMKELPKAPKNKRKAFWSEDTVREALNLMNSDPLLHLAVHLIFSCPLRNGEACGILIDSINLDSDEGKILIDRTLQRIKRDTLEKVDQSSIIKIFPGRQTNKTVLVFKNPKTEAGVRTVYITSFLRSEILRRLEEINHHKLFFDDEYHDHGLLICQPNGDPIEPDLLMRLFGN